MSPSTRSAIEWLAVIVGALVVALVVKTFLIQAFYIPSESMVPTLEVGDRVLVNKLSYRTGDVERGDIVVFARPGGPGPDGIADLIKRVVALPGETVEGRDGRVYVDGEALDEGYLEPEVTTSSFAPYEVPDEHVWVMGDNRGASDDSRRFKAVPLDDVVGRAFVIIWPLSEVGLL
jgi:signal peptidase I